MLINALRIAYNRLCHIASNLIKNCLKPLKSNCRAFYGHSERIIYIYVVKDGYCYKVLICYIYDNKSNRGVRMKQKTDRAGYMRAYQSKNRDKLTGKKGEAHFVVKPWTGSEGTVHNFSNVSKYLPA